MKNLSLTARLTAYFLCAGLGSLLLLGLVIHNYADKAITQRASNQLVAIRDVKKIAIEDYFLSLEARLRQLARNPGLRNALIDFDSAFKKGVNTPEYEEVQLRYGDDLTFLQGQNNLSDLFLVNVGGDAIWTAGRAQDFATNFAEGVFSRENIASAVRNGRREFNLTDFAAYTPADGQARLFAAAPVRSGNKLHGMVIVSVSPEKLQQICNQGEPEGSLTETFLVGDDFLMRSDSRFTEASDILTTQIKNPVIDEGSKGEQGVKIGKNHRPEEMLTAYTQMKFRNLRYVLAVEIPLAQVAEPLGVLSRITFMFCVIFSGITFFLASFFYKKVSRPIDRIHRFIRRLSKGEIPETDLTGNSDGEIGAIYKVLNQTAEKLRSTAGLAEQIEQGNLSSETEKPPASDRIGSILSTLQEKLRNEAEEIKKRERFADGLAIFSDLLRTDHITESFYDRLLSQLVKFSGANQGTIYIYAANEDVLNMKACYAFDRKKFEEASVRPGENLVGQVFLERKLLQTDDIPPNYLRITSGLGDAAPGNLLLVPLNVGETCCGVLELAAFAPFSNYEVDFVTKLSENISRTIISARNKIKNDRLLTEVKDRAQTMRENEVKMRKTLTELQEVKEAGGSKKKLK